MAGFNSRALSGTWAGRASQLSEIRSGLSLELCFGKSLATMKGLRGVFSCCFDGALWGCSYRHRRRN